MRCSQAATIHGRLSSNTVTFLNRRAVQPILIYFNLNNVPILLDQLKERFKPPSSDRLPRRSNLSMLGVLELPAKEQCYDHPGRIPVRLVFHRVHRIKPVDPAKILVPMIVG